MTKPNKRNVIVSAALAIILCISLMVGGTYAWFTDTASSSVNRIQAGTLDIALVDESGDSLEGKTLKWVAHDERGQDDIYWEPGCTYNTQPFYIVNKGNLNLKFKIFVSGINGDEKLAEVIDFTAMAKVNQFHFNTGAISGKPGGDEEFDMLEGYDFDTIFYGVKHFDEYTLEPGDKIGPVVIQGHMSEEADNEYQGLSIEDIVITLAATQGTGDEDSYNGTYDGEAEYPVKAETADALTTALEEGKDVVMADDMVLEKAVNIPKGSDVTIETNGKTLTCTAEYGAFDLKDGSNLTIAGGGEIKVNYATDKAQRLFNVSDKNSTLTVKDVVVTTDNEFIAVSAGTVIIESGTYNVTGGGTAVFAYGEDSKVIINGGKFIGTGGEGEGAVYAFNGATVEIYDGIFNIVDDETDYSYSGEVSYDTTAGTEVNWTLCDYSKMPSYPFEYGGVTVETAGKIKVYGGTYNKNVGKLLNLSWTEDPKFTVVEINYVADGYEAVESKDGTSWTVKKIEG